MIRPIRLSPWLVPILLFSLPLSPVLGEDTNPAHPPPKLPAGVKMIPNIEYAAPNGYSLLLDLYLPEQVEGRLPVVVWIHGGGWEAGSRNDQIAVPLAAHGYAVASIDYRLSQVAKFPAQIDDCKAAIRWLRAHARAYSLDPNHIGVWGASAGGHLVALLGTSGDVKELEGDEGNLDQSSRVQAVCDFCGPTDLLQFQAQAAKGPVHNPRNWDAPDSFSSRLIGGSIQENPEKAARANP